MPERSHAGDGNGDWGSEFSRRVERSLVQAVGAATAVSGPPKLAHALRYAVFPGGARIRPTFCLAVAKACGDGRPELANGVAAALELLHCASLVHDDLACFDNAAIRRSKPAVHVVHGESLAVLAGDGLIVLAFQCLAEAGRRSPELLAPLLLHISHSVGTVHGLVAGQAWELESSVDFAQYHKAKTGGLFEAAAMCGGLAGGGDGESWRSLGAKLGQAFQLADDIADVSADSVALGKPTRRDAALARPNLSRAMAPRHAFARLRELLLEAFDSVPAGADANFRNWLAGSIGALLRARLNWSLDDAPRARRDTWDCESHVESAAALGA